MEQQEEMQVGKVTHYFTKIGVAVIEVTDGSIKVGDKVHIKGHTSDFRQKVKSMQIEHENVQMAEPGQSIGMKVEEPVRAHDLVYKAV
jgi:putative protease